MKILARLYQKVLKLSSKFLYFREVRVIEGKNALLEVPKHIKNHQHVMVITDQVLYDLKLLQPLLEALEKETFHVTLFKDTKPNPTIKNVQQAYELYKASGSTAMIAFGGGSVIDCAKLVLAQAVNPHKPLRKMKGILKVRKKIPLMVAIPTTAGTGSEATVAAVVSDEDQKDKFAIMDPVLIPHIAVLDPLLTLSLPQTMTYQTGMDALTHAVEAYISQGATKKTNEHSLIAVKTIFENLEKVCLDPHDVTARLAMLKASYSAGYAFTRAYVGNVHAMAHALGGLYNLPHGYTNALILPYVLDYYGEKVSKKLAILSKHANLAQKSESNQKAAQLFIQKLRELNKKYGVKTYVEKLKEEDIEFLSQHAYREANPLYPVPVIFKQSDFRTLYYQILR